MDYSAWDIIQILNWVSYIKLNLINLIITSLKTEIYVYMIILPQAELSLFPLFRGMYSTLSMSDMFYDVFDKLFV